jgi:hypothetical protein
LTYLFDNGQTPENKVFSDADLAGFTERALQRAADHLGVSVTHEQTGVSWDLPEEIRKVIDGTATDEDMDKAFEIKPFERAALEQYAAESRGRRPVSIPFGMMYMLINRYSRRRRFEVIGMPPEFCAREDKLIRDVLEEIRKFVVASDLLVPHEPDGLRDEFDGIRQRRV